MKSQTCDICGAPIKEGTGGVLYTKYEVDGMKDCCAGCTRDLQEAHTRISLVANDLRDKWYVRYLRAYKAKKSGADVAVHKF